MKKHEEEILRLVQSGLSPDRLRAEMTRRLVQRAEGEEPEWGALLRAAAIPRRLDEGVVGVLRSAPDDADGNQAALQRLAAFPFVLPDPEGRSYALHEEVRVVLLEDWQATERRARYVELSRALWEYFARGGFAIRPPDDTSGGSEEAEQFVPFSHSLLESLYHRFAFDPAGAFGEFEGRFATADQFYRRAECGALLSAAEEQERELDQGQRLWLRYYRARLSLVLDRWAEAEAGYRALLAELIPSPPAPLPTQGEGRLRAWTLNDLGNALTDQGKWAEAVEMHQQALRGRRELGDRHGEGMTLMNIGTAYAFQSRWDQAIECYQQDLAICRELGDRHGEGQALINLGNVYQAQGCLDQAMTCHEESLCILRELGDRHGEGQTLINLGNVYWAQGRWEQAIECYQQDLAICRELGDRHGEGLTLVNLGRAYHVQGRWEQASEYYEASLHILRELGDRYGEGKTLDNLAKLHAQQGRMDEAITAWQKALALFKELGAPEATEVEQMLVLSKAPGCLRVWAVFGRLSQQLEWIAARVRRRWPSRRRRPGGGQQMAL